MDQRGTNLQPSPALEPQFVVGKSARIALFVQKTFRLKALQNLRLLVSIFFAPTTEFVSHLTAATLGLGTIGRSA